MPTGRLEHLEVLNPATGALIATDPVDSPQNVAATVARVRANQPEWEALGIEGRYHWLGKLRDWMLDNSERIADTMQAETGKVRADASNEPAYLADLINFYGTKAAKFIGERERPAPLPLLAAEEAADPVPALPRGRHHQPLELPADPGAGRRDPGPAGRCRGRDQALGVHPARPDRGDQGLEGGDRRPRRPRLRQGTGETGGALVDEVDYIQFTGSDRTGRKVMARAAETLTPVSLELGGKDPMIVLSDADVDRAANAAAWGGMMNSGQICISVERIYVEEPVYDEFVPS